MVTATAGAVSCFRWWANDPGQLFYAIIVSCLIASGALLAIVNQWRDFKKDGNSSDARTLVLSGILDSLHATVLHGGGKQFKNADLRICVHVPNRADQWFQITDYSGPEQGRGQGNTAKISQGVVGEAFRTGKVVHAKLPIGAHVVDFALNYGYTRQEAARLKQDCKSWIAVPIGEPSSLLAVLYCDSAQREFFGKSNEFRQKVINAAVLGIARFISNRNN